MTPGLFDSYSYLGVHEITLVEETVDAIHTGDHLTAAFDVRDAVNPRSTLIAINRVEGVTRVMVAPRSAHEADHIIAGLGATIDLGGGTAYADDTRRAMFVNPRRGRCPAGGADRVRLRCCYSAKRCRMRRTTSPTATRTTSAPGVNTRSAAWIWTPSPLCWPKTCR